MKKLVFLFAIILLVSSCKKEEEPAAQNPVYITTDVSSLDISGEPFLLSDGSLFLIGYNANNLEIIKVSQNGGITWQKNHTTGQQGSIYSVTEDNNGNIYLCGRSEQNGVDILVIKLDAAGEMVWIKKYGGNDFEEGNSIIRTADGNLVIGAEIDTPNNSHNLCLMKINTQGDSLWATNFGTVATELMQKVIQTADGGYLVVGMKAPSTNYKYLVKLTSQGIIQWDNEPALQNDFNISDIKELSNGGFVLCGYVEDDLNGDGDACMFVLDAQGNLGWVQILGDNQDDDIITSVIQTNSGTLLGVGYAANVDTEHSKAVVIVLSASGSKIKYAPYWAPTSTFATNIFKLPGSNIMAGYFYDENTEEIKLFTTRLNDNGDFLP